MFTRNYSLKKKRQKHLGLGRKNGHRGCAPRNGGKKKERRGLLEKRWKKKELMKKKKGGQEEDKKEVKGPPIGQK